MFSTPQVCRVAWMRVIEEVPLYQKLPPVVDALFLAAGVTGAAGAQRRRKHHHHHHHHHHSARILGPAAAAIPTAQGLFGSVE